MTEDATDEAYAFSTYSGNRPFVVDGGKRGSHWLEGPPSGARRYVCIWDIAGTLPPLVAARRALVAVDRNLPRVRTGAHDVDRALRICTRAVELPRALVDDHMVRAALLRQASTLRIDVGALGASRATFETGVAADVQSVGYEADDHMREPGTPSFASLDVTHVASRTVEGTAAAIRAARAVARHLDALARTATWSDAALFTIGALDDAGLQRLLDAVVESSSHMTGHAARVGAGVEARLHLALGTRELAGTLAVRPVDGGHVTASLTAEVPDADGDALHLSPEKGLAAWWRALREHELGDDELDRALLVEGDERRLGEVRAARGALIELLSSSPHVELAHSRVVVEVPRVPFDAALPELLGAVLEIWERVASQRSGLVE